MKAGKLAAVFGLGLGLALACLCLLSVGPVPVARALTYTVTNTKASGLGSLRQAILDANAGVGHDTITFGASVSGTIVLTGSLPTVSDDLTMSGPGASLLSISGDDAYRVLRINTGTAVTISGVTIRDGNAGGSPGGGIRSAGTLLLTATHIVSNTGAHGGGVYVSSGSARLSGGQIVSNTADYGGGVYVSEGSAALSGGQILSNTAEDSGGGVYVADGSVTLSGGQIIRNTAYEGGGIYIFSGTLTLINTTLSGNRAAVGEGGGLYANDGTTAITFTTVASNTAASGGYGIHLVDPAAVVIRNTIIALNGSTNCSGMLTSNGHNLEYGDTCNLTTATDLTDTNPLLGPLTYDRGTWVHPLLEGSPAINAGLCVAGIPTDQRGVRRIPPCDIGAYEAALQVHLPLALRNY